METHSVSAGLDYPGVGPEHSYLKDTGRATYTSATDDEALEAFGLLSRLEGIIPALEPSHALAHVAKLAPQAGPDKVIVVNLSGRGDKDLQEVIRVTSGSAARTGRRDGHRQGADELVRGPPAGVHVRAVRGPPRRRPPLPGGHAGPQGGPQRGRARAAAG